MAHIPPDIEQKMFKRVYTTCPILRARTETNR